MFDTLTLGLELPRPFKSPLIPFDVPTYSPHNRNGIIKAHLNISSSERRSGIYRPSFTYCQNPPGTNKPRHVLYVKASLPKLIFGNNFQEVTDIHRGQIVQILKRELERIGLNVSEQQIRTTDVTKIDVGKNVPYWNYVSTSQIIKDLSTADISSMYDVARQDFRNGGKSWRLHTNIEELVVYDKIYDLMRSRISEKRAIETDSYIQHNLLDKLTHHKNLSVVRVEVRLNGKRKIRDTLERAGIKNPSIKFEDIFSTDVARRVLNYEWNAILNRIPKVPLLADTPESLFVRILSDKEITPLKALAKLGQLQLLTVNDTRYVRNLFDERFGREAWGKIKGSRDPPSSEQLQNLLHISKAIEEMQPIDINDLIPK